MYIVRNNPVRTGKHPQTKDEHKLGLLRVDLVKELDLSKKYDIGRKIAAIKRALVMMGLYHRYECVKGDMWEH